MLTAVKPYIEGLAALLYPELCVTCNTKLHQAGQMLCTPCRNTLPETGFDAKEQNIVKDMFTGRMPVEGAMSLLFFEKGSKYRKLLYALKYRQHVKVGHFLGQLLGSRLAASNQSFDAIVPVPLHRKRQRSRGYNQSTFIAKGIAEIIGVPVLEKVLVRKVYNPTQTRKGRYARWENVSGIFACKHSEKIANKHVLLVDDVLTTGATLEAAGTELLAVPGVCLSVATVAYAFN